MSDARDALAEAMALTKKLAAGRLVRKERLEAELARLQIERARLEGVPLQAEVDARIQVVSTELAAAESELADALNEIKELERLAREERAAGARGTVAAATAQDEILKSLEESTLDSVRDHIRSLEAQSRLARELEDLGEADTPPADVVEKPAAPKDADADAKAEFERLRSGKPKKTL